MANKKVRQMQWEQARRRARMRRLLYAVIGVGLYISPSHAASSTVASNSSCSDIQTLADEGNAHLPPGLTHDYEANPPVSGPHDPNPWSAGVYDTPIPATREVHSLEHGYVIIHYHGIPADELEQLKTLVGADSWKMILSPLPTMSFKISLTAWDHVQACGSVDNKVIHNFVNQFRDHGPEQTPM